MYDTEPVRVEQDTVTAMTGDELISRQIVDQACAEQLQPALEQCIQDAIDLDPVSHPPQALNTAKADEQGNRQLI